jgi:hypothetical protein
MFQLTLEYLPHGDESKSQKIGFARVCNLREHEPGSELGSFHGYFEIDGEREINAFVKDYPRTKGTPWHLVAALFEAAEVTRAVASGE